MIVCRGLQHLHHFAHFRDRFTHLALDSHLQCHRAAGAASACALKAHFQYRTIDFDDLHVAAVSHQERSQLIEHLLHILNTDLWVYLFRQLDGCETKTISFFLADYQAFKIGS